MVPLQGWPLLGLAEEELGAKPELVSYPLKSSKKKKSNLPQVAGCENVKMMPQAEMNYLWNIPALQWESPYSLLTLET